MVGEVVVGEKERASVEGMCYIYIDVHVDMNVVEKRHFLRFVYRTALVVQFGHGHVVWQRLAVSGPLFVDLRRERLVVWNSHGTRYRYSVIASIVLFIDDDRRKRYTRSATNKI